MRGGVGLIKVKHNSEHKPRVQVSTRLRARPVKNVSDKGNASQFRRFWSVLVPELTVKVCYSDHHLAFHREFKHV
jgi:hypothetical protein